jgi:hypothetical protein
MIQLPTGLRVLAGFEPAAFHLMVLYEGMRGIASLNQSDTLNSILSRTEIGIVISLIPSLLKLNMVALK